MAHTLPHSQACNGVQRGTCGKFSRETPRIGHHDIDELALAAFRGCQMAESEIFKTNKTRWQFETKQIGFLSGCLTLLITLDDEIG